MEKYNLIDQNYKLSFRNPKRVYAIKIELLSYYESPIKDMTFIAIKDVVGTISSNNQQLTRKTCSLNLLNYDENISDFIYYGNKFALYIGVLVGSDIYWISQGIFVVQNASRNKDYFTLEGVDKGGILDGSVGSNSVETQYIVPVGSNIRDVIKDILTLNIENHITIPVSSSVFSRPIDPTDVLVDMWYKNIYTQAEISIDSNSPIGDLIVSWADGYFANVYYDKNGRLNFVRNIASSLTENYNKLPINWIFDDSQVHEAQYSKRSDIKNVVTVYTNSANFENVSATTYNTNPQSPNRIDLIGIRRMESVEIPYVGATPKEQKKYCEAHGEYLLSQEEFNQNSINLSVILIPHLDVGDRIMYGEDSFIINSININLDGTDMSIAANQIR